MPDSATSSALLRSSGNIQGAAALDAEKSKISALLRRKKDVANVLRADRGITRKLYYQFHPFGMDVYGAPGPEARKAFMQFSKLGAGRFNKSPASCRRKILQAINVALIFANAKMLRFRRPQLRDSIYGLFRTA